MVYVIVTLIILIIVILIAVNIGLNDDENEPPDSSKVIHRSGIYSIVRKSPREDISSVKPSIEEIRKYLQGVTEDINNSSVGKDEQEALVRLWKNLLEDSLAEVEKGDKEGVDYYYFKYDESDTVCREYIHQGNFVTRKEIFEYPELIPPFHLGCTCRLLGYRDASETSDTTSLQNMAPFFRDHSRPPLPDWKTVINV